MVKEAELARWESILSGRRMRRSGRGSNCHRGQSGRRSSREMGPGNW